MAASKKKTARKTATKAHPHLAAVRELRAFGLAYPEAHTKSPWPGHLDLAVRDKTFAYLSLDGDPLHLTCKLPASCEVALTLPFAKPAPYGLGKSGWVAVDLDVKDKPPVELFKSWIDESYRAQAPKALLKQLEAGGPKASLKPSPRAKRAKR